MQLQRVVITGFGKLADREYVFTPGFNLICGPNESGKSTLQAFIRAMLYGLKAPDARRRQWLPEHEKFFPWSGAPYGGALEFLDSENRLYRVERSFARASDKARIFDCITGADLSGNFKTDKRRELLFAEHFTGMNELVFNGTVFINDVPDANTDKGRRELAARLANLQESGDEATSVRRAVERLEAMRRSVAARLKEATAREAEAAAEWDNLRQHRGAIRALEVSIAALRANRASLETELAQAEQQILALNIMALEHQEGQALKLQAECTELARLVDSLAIYASFPSHLYESVEKVAARREAVVVRLAEIDENLAQAQIVVTAEQERLNALPAAVSIGQALGNPEFASQVERLAVKLPEVAAHVQEAARICVDAEVESSQAQEAYLALQHLADFPSNTPQLLAECATVEKEAADLGRRWRALAARCADWQKRGANYRHRAEEITNELERSAHLSQLPADSGRKLEELAAEAHALTRSLQTAQTTSVALSRRIEALQNALQRTAQMDSLPAGSDIRAQELAATAGVHKQAVAALAPIVKQVQGAQHRLETAQSSLSEVEQNLHRVAHLAGIQAADLKSAAGHVAAWQSAENQAAMAEARLGELANRTDQLHKELASLDAVAAEGAVALAKAAHLAAEVETARDKERAAAQAAEAVPLPARGRSRTGWASIGVGVALSMTSGIIKGLAGWPMVVVWAFALGLFSVGITLVYKHAQAMREYNAERNRHFAAKSDALGTAERMSTQLRTALARVNQPSVTAWEKAWQRYNTLAADLSDVQHETARFTERRQTALAEAEQAQQAVASLFLRAGCESLAGLKASQASAALHKLADEIADRDVLNQEQASLHAALDSAAAQAEQGLLAVGDMVRQMLPHERIPQTATVAWVDQVLQRSIDTARAAEQEVQQLLSAAGAATVAEFTRIWQERQQMLANLADLRQEAAGNNQLMLEITAQRQQYIDNVLQLLTTAGITPAQENRTTAIPWSAADLTAFSAAVGRYNHLKTLVAALPQEIPPLLHEASQIQEELQACQTSSQNLQSRVSVVVQELPIMAEPALLAAATAESNLDDFDQTVDKATLPTHLWPDELHKAVMAMPSWRCFTNWEAMVTGLEGTAHALLNDALATAGVANVPAFNKLWKEWEQVNSQAKERAQVLARCQAGFNSQVENLHQLLVQDVEPVLAIAAVDAPSILLQPETRLGELEQGLAAWVAATQMAADRVAAVEKQQSTLQAARDTVASKQQERDEQAQGKAKLDVELQELLVAGGVATVADFKVACEEQARLQRTCQLQDARQRELAVILGGRSMEQLQQELAMLRGEWCKRTNQAELSRNLATADRAFWAEQLKAVQAKLTEVNNALLQAETELAMHMEACAGDEACMAKLQTAQDDAAAANAALQVVQLARQELDSAAEAVHRQFAPALNARASGILKRLTRGRYTRLTVSEALEIRLTDPEYAKQVDMGSVSRGTCDQVYLAFRLAAAQAICAGALNPPLMLDDAFAHYDDVRVMEALDALLSLADETQVLFFTCRQREATALQELAKNRSMGCNVLQMT